MQSEIKSYSIGLTETSLPAIITPETLKKVAQAVVEEEDRSKNIMLYRLEELKNLILSKLAKFLLLSVKSPALCLTSWQEISQ